MVVFIYVLCFFDEATKHQLNEKNFYFEKKKSGKNWQIFKSLKIVQNNIFNDVTKKVLSVENGSVSLF